MYIYISYIYTSPNRLPPCSEVRCPLSADLLPRPCAGSKALACGGWVLWDHPKDRSMVKHWPSISVIFTCNSVNKITYHPYTHSPSIESILITMIFYDHVKKTLETPLDIKWKHKHTSFNMDFYFHRKHLHVFSPKGACLIKMCGASASD